MREKDELILQIKEIVEYIKKYKRVVLLWIVLASITGGIIAGFMTQKVYYSSAEIYVRPIRADGEILSDDLNASQQLIQDFIEIMQSRSVLENVITDMGMEDILNAKALQDLIYVSSDYQSRIVHILVAGTEPSQTQQIAEKLCFHAVEKAEEATGVPWAVVSDKPNLPRRQAYPVLWRSVLQSVALSAALLFFFLIIVTSGQRKINDKGDVQRYLDISVLGVIPDYSLKG